MSHCLEEIEVSKDKMGESMIVWIKSMLHREPRLRLKPEVGGTAAVRETGWLSKVDWDAMLDQTEKPPRLR